MVNIRPMKIPGRWRDGFVLDFHTVSSTYLGDDEYGHPQFETKLSEAGELLYKLKYGAEISALKPLAESVAAFIASWKPGADLIVPVPPSRSRRMQPVLLLAEAVANQLGLHYFPNCVTKIRETPELKDIFDYNERIRLLSGAHRIDKAPVAGRRVLLFDDLYRSGATMNAIAAALYDEGGATDVVALAVTRTRSRQ